MNILFVTPYVPSLIRVRPLNFLKQLSRHHRITLVALACGDPSEAQNIEDVRDYCENVHILHLGKIQSHLNCARHLCTRVPLQVAYTHHAEAQDFVAHIAETGNFDMVHVEHIRGAYLVNGVKTSIPKVYDSVDCITRLLKQKLEHRNGTPFGLAIDLIEMQRMPSYEAKVAAQFEKTIITSALDQKALEYLIRHTDGCTHRSYTPEVKIIANGVDSEYFHPMNGYSQNVEIVFSGKMSYAPNVGAVMQFYDEVFPKIRWMRPEVRLKIVGADPADAIRKLSKDHAVEVTGYVPDIRPHLANARVVVCPLTVGVGIQNKVLEAMAMAKPVVATSVACKGIPDAVYGKHLICADDAERMASDILYILDHPNKGDILGKNAVKLVKEKYDWEASTRDLESVYAELVDMSKRKVAHAA